jgi:translation initiation factor eIF-2B subunit epsilon
MSMNASEHQVRRAAAAAFCKWLKELVREGVNIKTAVAKVFGPHRELLERTMFDRGNSDKVDQVDFMLLLQSILVNTVNGDLILLNTAIKLNEMEVLQDEAVEQWWEDPRSREGEAMVGVRGKTEAFVTFLRNLEEDSESGEDESEDE